MSEEETETICISKQKVRELLKLFTEVRQILRGDENQLKK